MGVRAKQRQNQENHKMILCTLRSWTNFKNYISSSYTVLCEKGKTFPFSTPMTLGSLSLYQQCSSSFLSFVNCKKVTFFFDSCITFLLPWKISHTACEDHFNRWIKNRTSCVRNHDQLMGSMLRWEDKHVT